MTTVTKEAAVVETPTTCGLLLSTFNTKLPLAGALEGVRVIVLVEPTVVPAANSTSFRRNANFPNRERRRGRRRERSRRNRDLRLNGGNRSRRGNRRNGWGWERKVG
jgi:hypothetical protein